MPTSLTLNSRRRITGDLQATAGAAEHSRRRQPASVHNTQRDVSEIHQASVPLASATNVGAFDLTLDGAADANHPTMDDPQTPPPATIITARQGVKRKSPHDAGGSGEEYGGPVELLRFKDRRYITAKPMRKHRWHVDMFTNLPASLPRVRVLAAFHPTEEHAKFVLHWNSVEPNWGKGYLPGDKVHRHRIMARLWPLQYAKAKAEREAKLAAKRVDDRGEVRAETGQEQVHPLLSPPDWKDNGFEAGMRTAASPDTGTGRLGADKDTVPGLWNLPVDTIKFPRRPRLLLIQCSLFVAVLLNVQAKYGVDVTKYIERLLPAASTDLGMVGMDEAKIAADAAMRSGKTESAAMGTALPERNGALVHDFVHASRPKTPVEREVQALTKKWESRFPGIMGWRGSQLVEFDAAIPHDFDPLLLAALGLKGRAQEDGIGLMFSVFVAELEAECHRRTIAPATFRGIGG